jgi:hypothetical protein
MKKCSYCGKVYADTATICEVDGKPLWQVDPPQLPGTLPSPGNSREIVDNEHLKLLAIFHYVFAGLAALGLMVMLVEFLIMGAVIGTAAAHSSRSSSGPPPEFIVALLGLFFLLVSAMLAAIVICNILSGNFMRKRRNRTFSFVVACANCLQVPFGTALGVFTIVVLSRESVRAQYAAGQPAQARG